VSGDFDTSDSVRSGRPAEFDNDALKSLVDSDPRLTVSEIANTLGATRSTVQRHFHEIGKSHRQGI
jgi:[histone H3]-lysine36 N-dimethyltransferase SETMAR